MASSGDIRQILSPARFNMLDSDTQAVIVQAWNTHTGSLKAELEKTRVDSEQKSIVLQKKVQDLESKLSVFAEESEKGQSALSMYREQATASGATVARLSEENSSIVAERDELKRQIYNAKAEKEDVSGLSDRRQEEIERLHARIGELSDELKRAVTAKCEAEARLDDLGNKEMSLSFKERRFNEEKEFLQSQISALQGEVEKLNSEVLSTKRESGLRILEGSQELAEKEEELATARRREEAATQDAASYKSRAEGLTERLREARDSETRLEESYRAELKSQTRLADLYKEQGEENTAKTEELTNAVNSLQKMVREAGEKYGKLEEKLEAQKIKHKEELNVRGESVTALRRELEDANKLIKTVKDKGLTEDAMEHLSPSAAQASRLLKSGVTLTGIYSQMVSLSEELAGEKEENKRLNGHLDQILAEIEERAPLLRQQREDYEQAMSAVGGLTENLEAAREEVDLRRHEAEEERRKASSLEKDRDKLERQVLDMGRQITVLVREVEASRTGLPNTQPLERADLSSADSVIEARLLEFKDVSELQQRNIELLAVVRELGASREMAESALVEEKTAEVRQELDTALRQVEELRSARERQKLMVENIIQQRDLYKSMCGAGKEAAHTQGNKKVETVANEDSDKRVKEVESQLCEVKKDFAEYKKEKAENYNMLEQDCRKLRDDLFEARSQAAKMSSHEEYNTERFNIAQANCASYKKQIEALEMRNKQLDTIMAKHEESVSTLRDELFKASRKLVKAELQTDQLKQENSHLKSVEARISAEREVLYKEKNSSNQIMANLQQIQINLERREEESRQQLQRSNQELNKELDLLRKRLEAEQENFKVSVRTWENSNRELREKAERSDEGEKKALTEMTGMTSLNETLKEEVKELKDELQLAQSRLTGRGQISTQSSMVEGDAKSRYRDVEILLGKSKQEIKQLNTQLAAEKKKVEEYKMISETSEKRMLESSKAMSDYKTESDKKTKVLEDEKKAAETISASSTSTIQELKKKIEDLESEVGTSGGELRDKLKMTSSELEAAQDRITHLEHQDKEVRQRLEVLAAEAKEAQEKYQVELVNHAKDIEEVNRLKGEKSSSASNLEEVELEKKRTENSLAEIKASMQSELDLRSKNLSSVQEQLAVLTQENKAMYNQLELVSGQLKDVSATGQMLNTSVGELNVSTRDPANLDTSTMSNTSIRSLNDEEASSDQLMGILKYLRKEKELISNQLESAQSELTRVSRQLEHAKRRTDQAETTLETERTERSENLMTASKHAELIRKVESLAALTDSNRLLRDEKDRLAEIVESSTLRATEALAKVEPLELKLKEAEERASTLQVEKAAIQLESEGWKKRSDQLVEKSFKMNPEELKRLQTAETDLTRQVHSMRTEKVRLTNQLSTINKELTELKASNAAVVAEAKKLKEETDKRTRELKMAANRENSQKNQLANLSKTNNELKKKIDEADKVNKENTAALNKTKLELDAATKTAGEVSSQEVADLKKKAEADAEQLKTSKGTIKSLRNIGRQFREKTTQVEKEKQALDEEVAALKTKLTEKEAELTSKHADLVNAQSLMDSMGPESLAKALEEVDILKGKNDTLEVKLKSNQEKFKGVVETAKTKIKKLQEQVKDKSQDEKSQEIAHLNEEAEKAAAEKDQMKAALESAINKLRKENDTLKNSLKEVKDEKEKQTEQLEQLQLELQTSQATAKPVAVAGVVHQQEPRKQTQPQAHIQPHRHQPPRDEHRPTQTASIRPMTQRAATQAVVLPTSQVSSAAAEVATVQPTVSVSPSVSSAATPQLPTTSQLDPAASEFVPADRAVPDSGEDSLRIAAGRMDASTSGPAVSVHNAQTSTSSNTTTTASVPPTLKRTREVEAEYLAEEGEAGPSGTGKKARIVSAEAVVAVAEVAEDEEEAELDDEVEVDEEDGAFNEAVSSEVISTDTGDVVEEQDTAVDEEMEPDMDAGEMSEDGEEDSAAPVDIDALADAEDDEETGLDQEDVEADPVADDIADLGEAEKEMEEEEDQDQPENIQEEDVTGENSSEPSSSTGAAVAPGQSTSHHQGFEQEAAEDSVVPSTPKLAEPRRPEGFSEAVSSPQVPTNERFVFGPSSGRSTAAVASVPEVLVTSSNLVGQEGAERTNVDISQLAEDKAAAPVVPDIQPVSPHPSAVEEGELVDDSMEDGTGVESEVSAPTTGEEGVSSSGAETTVPKRGRTPITWSKPSAAGPASTSPQRTLNREGIASVAAAGLANRALRGMGKGRGKKSTRGAPPPPGPN